MNNLERGTSRGHRRDPSIRLATKNRRASERTLATETIVARAKRRTETLGRAQLGIGLAVAGALLITAALTYFLMTVGSFSSPALPIAAWGALLGVCIFVVVDTRRNSYILDDTANAILLISLGAVVGLDLAGVWGDTAPGVGPTAAIAVGGVLLGIVPLRPVRDVVLATGVLTAVLLAAIALEYDELTVDLAPELASLGCTVIPVIVACVIVSSYRRMVSMTIDRILIQSTVDAPAFAPSTTGGDELSAIDREVEQLFDDVASGREELPLRAERAERASELATALRMSLVANRRHTWLYHAITESDYLAPRVTLDDEHALAARLSQLQRDGLLSALWLIMADPRVQRTATLRFSPIGEFKGSVDPHLEFVILLEVQGLRRVDVEPATWENLARVGSYIDTAVARTFSVRIECRVAGHDSSSS